MEPIPTAPAPSPIPAPGAIICAREECRARIPSSGGSGEPFRSGPWKGGYWCQDCWTLWYDENPWHLADQATKDYIAYEARRIRDSRETAEILYEEPLVRLTLTSRGTVRIVFQKQDGMAADECDPPRLQALARGLEALLIGLPTWFPEKTPAPLA
jgi:hypothetical protein